MSAHPSQVLGLHQLKDPDRNWAPSLQQLSGSWEFTEHLQEEGELYPLLSKKTLTSCKPHLTFSLSYKERAASGSLSLQLPVFFLPVKLEGVRTCQWSAGCLLTRTVRERSQNYWGTLHPQKALCSGGAGLSPRLSKPFLSLSINIICICALSS